MITSQNIISIIIEFDCIKWAEVIRYVYKDGM